jgi:ATP-dependent Lhr-like helicase
MVGQTSKGRIFPTHREDIVEAAAIAGGMLRGDVELTQTPRQPLDVLAQHIVAMVSVQPWDVDALYDLVRCAYAYNDLTRRTYQITLEMLAGRYPSRAYRELRPRLAWDRVNQKLAPLPGSRWLALTNGGTIPDTGTFSATLSDGKTKLGELDEEFVFETRVGDTLMLGSQVWRVIDLTDDRVVVAEAPGAVPRMPFWRGDVPWRPYDLGKRVGEFRRKVAERLEQIRNELGLERFRAIREHRDQPQVTDALDWLGKSYALDVFSAWQVLDYLAGQLDHTGAASSDRTILIELFEDALGDPRLVVHSPFGGRVNGPWGLALTGALRERTGVEVEVQTNDDGILLRLLDAEATFPLDVVTGMGPAEARERILLELPDSAVFGARFRQNAARALLLPRVRGGKRTPFWLQRLRAKDLLQVVRQFDDFPIVAETFRDCLQDVLDLPHLKQILSAIQRGDIKLVVVESINPSPVAQSLLWDFVNVYMYEWDAPRAERQLQMLATNRDLLQDLLKDVALDELLRPEALQDVRGQLQHSAPGYWARTVEELAVLLQRMGDLSTSEIALRTAIDPADWIASLSSENRISLLAIPTALGPRERWVASEYVDEFALAFGPDETSSTPPQREAQLRILERFLGHSGPVTFEDIRARYAFPKDWLLANLDRLIEERELIHGHFTPQPAAIKPAERPAEYIEARTLEQIHRRSLHILRNEVQPVSYATYADFLAGWQHLTPAESASGDGALLKVLQQLRAAAVVGRVWERDVLSLRLQRYQPSELDALCQSGDVVWIASGGSDPRRARVRFLFRGEGNVYLEQATDDLAAFSEQALAVHSFLKSEGAVFFDDLCLALELPGEAVELALIELVMAGLVTNDSVEALRKLLDEGSPQISVRQPFSPLEAQLARRREAAGPRPHPRRRRPSPSRYKAAKKRVRQRLESPSASYVKPTRWVGRWTLVHRFGVLGKAVELADRTAQQARQLLARYGVVTHACLADEIGAWEWSPIYQQLKRMEMRGEVRRGYFIQGLPGLQFALPEAVERLRAVRDGGRTDLPLVVMNACDPANLYGPSRDDLPLTQDGAPLAFSRVPSTWLALHRGLPVLIARDHFANLVTVQGADEAIVQQGLSALLGHISRFEYRVTVQRWNGSSVLGSPGQMLLERVGFYRDYPGMAWERT